MSLNDKLKEVTIKEIESLSIFSLDYYARENKKVLNFLYKQKIIDDASIENAIKKPVLKEAREDYDLMLKKTKDKWSKVYPDHLARPEFLAYGISNNIFSLMELRKIPFDHGENPEKYCKLYDKKNLLSILREELLNPREPIKFSTDYDFCCSCDH
jgi:hypothetical protein